MIASGRFARVLSRFCRAGATSLLVLALGASAASAQSAGESGFTLEDIAIRDNLIAAQETLLNVYRCQFGVDIGAVAGGCTNGHPALGFSQPAEFEGIPTSEDIAIRDRLVAVQEALLNTYRCRFEFDIDTHITPDGCPGQPSSEPTLPVALDALVRPDDLEGGLPPGLITPRGVSVAVMGVNEGRFVVTTPCGSISTVSSGLPLRGVRVVVDPGHGGSYDIGAVGPNGLAERDLNLTLSYAVMNELSSRGIPAASTRNGHYGSTLSVRSAFADALGAEALISIHHNGPTFSIGSRPGTEVYVQSVSAQQARADSARLGGLLHQEITNALAGFENVWWSRVLDAGVLRVLSTRGRDAYGMISLPNVPAVLVEYGYLTNRSEAALFATDEYIRVAAKATVNAIEAYLNTDRSGTESNRRPRVFNPARAPSSCNEVALE
ncbi:MAG: N-acetylmuramoyl-L-alanine amidase [Acidimicrobiia bacterium]|nr:N-acetylmuramoyl-L-alanine amidase [Acidimicrobiia bacterium]MYG57293.1 N-acetylmuramoyl-L-alanine amidase [Acidimicrobiia bacterium]MYJ31948.1 N-acetylmuramoyl-L-alanine amidase [Acidimicrobiia bacterium]